MEIFDKARRLIISDTVVTEDDTEYIQKSPSITDISNVSVNHVITNTLENFWIRLQTSSSGLINRLEYKPSSRYVNYKHVIYTYDQSQFNDIRISLLDSIDRHSAYRFKRLDGSYIYYKSFKTEYDETYILEPVVRLPDSGETDHIYLMDGNYYGYDNGYFKFDVIEFTDMSIKDLDYHITDDKIYFPSIIMKNPPTSKIKLTYDILFEGSQNPKTYQFEYDASSAFTFEVIDEIPSYENRQENVIYLQEIIENNIEYILAAYYDANTIIWRKADWRYPLNESGFGWYKFEKRQLQIPINILNYYGYDDSLDFLDGCTLLSLNNVIDHEAQTIQSIKIAAFEIFGEIVNEQYVMMQPNRYGMPNDSFLDFKLIYDERLSSIDRSSTYIWSKQSYINSEVELHYTDPSGVEHIVRNYGVLEDVGKFPLGSSFKWVVTGVDYNAGAYLYDNDNMLYYQRLQFKNYIPNTEVIITPYYGDDISGLWTIKQTDPQTDIFVIKPDMYIRYDIKSHNYENMVPDNAYQIIADNRSELSSIHTLRPYAFQRISYEQCSNISYMILHIDTLCLRYGTGDVLLCTSDREPPKDDEGHYIQRYQYVKIIPNDIKLQKMRVTSNYIRYMESYSIDLTEDEHADSFEINIIITNQNGIAYADDPSVRYSGNLIFIDVNKIKYELFHHGDMTINSVKCYPNEPVYDIYYQSVEPNDIFNIRAISPPESQTIIFDPDDPITLKVNVEYIYQPTASRLYIAPSNPLGTITRQEMIDGSHFIPIDTNWHDDYNNYIEWYIGDIYIYDTNDRLRVTLNNIRFNYYPDLNTFGYTVINDPDPYSFEEAVLEHITITIGENGINVISGGFDKSEWCLWYFGKVVIQYEHWIRAVPKQINEINNLSGVRCNIYDVESEEYDIHGAYSDAEIEIKKFN